jgi:hypothetical protein
VFFSNRTQKTVSPPILVNSYIGGSVLNRIGASWGVMNGSFSQKGPDTTTPLPFFSFISFSDCIAGSPNAEAGVEGGVISTLVQGSSLVVVTGPTGPESFYVSVG